ncbi:MAG: L-threonylcarbamoyladenylate synthase [Chthoniobacter sp.]
METLILNTNTPRRLAAAVKAAAGELADGQCVGLPTETVYGLAADALRPDAVTQIFEAKERPFFDPLIVHLPSREWLEAVTKIPDESRAMVEALVTKFWPGPLTLVLPRRVIVPDIVTAGLDTVAVRMSAHPVFRAVVEYYGQPLAAPSANRFGHISPTAAAHVMSELGERIPLIVDGGPTQHGVESTIVKVDSGELTMLRAGPVTPEDLGGVFHALCEARNYRPTEAEVAHFYERLGVSFAKMVRGEDNVSMVAPGQMDSHYAPRTPLRLIAPGVQVEIYSGENEAAARLGSLAFCQPSTASSHFICEEILSPTGDLREAAATLFAKMRRLDEAGLDMIIAEQVPENGLGIAIMDRLRKASA